MSPSVASFTNSSLLSFSLNPKSHYMQKYRLLHYSQYANWLSIQFFVSSRPSHAPPTQQKVKWQTTCCLRWLSVMTAPPLYDNVSVMWYGLMPCSSGNVNYFWLRIVSYFQYIFRVRTLMWIVKIDLHLLTGTIVYNLLEVA